MTAKAPPSVSPLLLHSHPVTITHSHYQSHPATVTQSHKHTEVRKLRSPHREVCGTINTLSPTVNTTHSLPT